STQRGPEESCARRGWLCCLRASCARLWTTRTKVLRVPWPHLIVRWRAASAGPGSLTIYTDLLLAADARRGFAAIAVTVTSTEALIGILVKKKQFRFKALPRARLHRNSHRGPQSAHRAVAEHDVAAVRACDVARNGEAQAAARFILIPGAVKAEEGLEYIIAPVRRFTRAVVVDCDGHVAMVAVAGDGDCRRKASRVRNQITQAALEGVGSYR